MAKAKSIPGFLTASLNSSREDATRQIVAAQNAVQSSLAAHAAAQDLQAAAQVTYGKRSVIHASLNLTNHLWWIAREDDRGGHRSESGQRVNGFL